MVPGVCRLLAARPEAAVICASRLPLDIRAEHIHPVHALSLGPHGDAVRLFTERVSPHYRHVVAAEQHEVLEICEHAEGIPLVLELVAEAVGPLSPRELLHRLRMGRYGRHRRLRDLPERHRSIEHALAWGEAALAHEDTELLKRLSVCDSPVDVATARRLLDTSSEQAVHGLGTLVHKSLLMSGASDRGGYQFTMPRVIRDQYRRELEREPQMMSAVRRRHAATTMALLAQVRRDLRASSSVPAGGGRRPERLDIARSRHSDVHAAVRYLREAGQHAEALRLLTLLEEPLLRHGLVARCTTFGEYVDAMESVAQCLAERPRGGRPAAEAMVMTAGWAMTWGQVDRARSLLAQADAACPEDAPGALRARITAGRCELLRRTGRDATARPLLAGARCDLLAAGRHSAAATLVRTEALLLAAEDPRAAERLLLGADRDLAGRRCDPLVRAAVRIELARLLRDSGRTTAAHGLAREAVAVLARSTAPPHLAAAADTL
ncbi:hypothetical protein, partial [Streptomyces sp. SM14]|uniref:hypothetical protein n=2 Tax=unclassified Streptomyces TaxID=2593676 RepID=UPI0011B02057